MFKSYGFGSCGYSMVGNDTFVHASLIKCFDVDKAYEDFF